MNGQGDLWCSVPRDRSRIRVKMRKTQNEQMISALPQTSDIARQRSLAEKTISGSTRFHPMVSNGLLSCHEPVRRYRYRATRHQLHIANDPSGSGAASN